MKRMSFYLTAAVVTAAALSSPAIVNATLERSPRTAAPEHTEASVSETAQFAQFKQQNSVARQRVLPGVTDGVFDLEAMTPAPAAVTMQPRNVMARTAEEPCATLYGVFPSYQGATSSTDACYAKINPLTGRWSLIYKNPIYQIGSESSDYCFQSGAVRDGILYIPHFDENMSTNEYIITWRRIDTETGEILPTLHFGANLNAFLYSMTYDSSRDCFWGLAVSFGGQNGGNLVRINCKDGNGKPIDPSDWYTISTGINMGPQSGNFAANVAYCPLDNNLYTLRDSGELWTLNPERDQAPVKVAAYDKSENPYCFPAVYEACPMVYSPRDHAFILNYINNSIQAMQLFTIDAETYDAYEIADLSPVGYLSTLICTDEYATDDAPDRVENLKVNLDGSSLAGSYEFDMPTTTFGGLALDANTKLQTVIEIDGTRVALNQYLPGQHVKENYTFSEGLHHIRVFARLSTKILGAGVQLRFYAGNDEPYPAKNASLNDDLLTWTAPQAGGIHGGYVDNNAMTYDVFINGQKSNATPLTECKYVIPQPNEQTRFNIVVKALVNGKYSEPTANITRVFGPALILPQTITPTAAQANLCDVIDGNKDSDGNFNFFRFDTPKNDIPQWAIGTDYYYRQPDDYLFLPKMKFDDNTKQYQLSFDYKYYYQSANWKAYSKIYLAKVVDTKSDAAEIYTLEGDVVLDWKAYTVRFTVPEPGDYYIVIHESSDTPNKCRGARYANFKVEKLDYTTDAPIEPSDVSITAAANGALSAKVSFTAPTVNMRGEALAAGEKLTVTAENGDFTNSVQTTPGAKGEIEIGAEADGWQRIYLTVASDKGASIPKHYLGYVGLDRPTAPQNIKGVVTDDNLGLHITWDAPKIGMNGGYVDPNNIDYNCYKVDGVTYNFIETVHNDREWTFRVNPGKQHPYYAGPTAKNEHGESTGSQFVFDILGTPYQLPMIEEFPTTAFNLTPWYMGTTGAYSSTQWQNASNLSTLNIGNPIPNQGLFYAINLSEGSSMGHLMAPKFTTKNVERASVNIRYWSCSSSAPMELYARSNKDQTLKSIASLNARQTLGSQWKDWKVDLPAEYLDCEWVQVDIISTHRNSTTYAVIDSYSILQEVDYDFQVTDITAPYNTVVGDKPEFTATITNGGMEASKSTLTMELLGDGKVVETKTFDIARLQPNTIYVQKTNFEMRAEYSEYSVMSVRATVSCDGDHIDHNNSKEAEFILLDHTLPLVRDLSAEWADDNRKAVNLTWTQPNTAMSGTESFEALPAFQITNQIGQWTNIDVDKKVPFVIENVSWEGNNLPQGWTVINHDYTNTKDDDRFAAHSGNQFLLARTPEYYDISQSGEAAAEDWLISPEVKGGQTVKFWMNCLDPASYTETITIMYSTTDANIDMDGMTEIPNALPNGKSDYTSGSFRLLCHFSKYGADSWEPLEFKLPEDAKYFAFVYRSKGMFGAMIDDIEFEPANEGNWDLDSYEVVRNLDGTDRTIATGLQTPGYVDTDNDGFAAEYFVATRYKSGGTTFLSPKGNGAAVDGKNPSSVDNIFGENTFVGGTKGYIFFGGLTGQEAAVFSSDGKMLKKMTIASDRELHNFDKGVYLVKIGKNTVKVIVK